MRQLVGLVLLWASVAWATDPCPRWIGLNENGVVEYCDANGVSHFLGVANSAGVVPEPTPAIYTVATLPVCNVANSGRLATVSDAVTCAYATTPDGGGAQSCPVVCDGTGHWIGG